MRSVRGPCVAGARGKFPPFTPLWACLVFINSRSCPIEPLVSACFLFWWPGNLFCGWLSHVRLLVPFVLLIHGSPITGMVENLCVIPWEVPLLKYIGRLPPTWTGLAWNYWRALCFIRGLLQANMKENQNVKCWYFFIVCTLFLLYFGIFAYIICGYFINGISYL